MIHATDVNKWLNFTKKHAIDVNIEQNNSNCRTPK